MGKKELSIPEVIEEESGKRTQFEVLTEGLRRKAEQISPDIFQLGPADLEEKAQPTVLMRRLKLRFWQEYQKVISNGNPSISPVTIYQDLCSKQYFYERIVGNENVFGWLLSPVTDYETKVEEALDFAIERIRAEILTAPLFDAKGKFDNYVAGTVLTAAKFLDARAKGSPLQRVQQQSLHVHRHEGHAPVTKDNLSEQLEEIQRKLNMHQTPQLNERVASEIQEEE